MRYRLGVLLFLCATGQAADRAPSVVLTAVENGLDSQSEFTCHGKIHGYIRLPGPQSGSHLLDSRWILPNGKLAADSRSPLDFKPARSTAYVWFSFPEGSSLLSELDPRLDQERLDYNGLWRLDVLWDEKALLKQTFTVHCP